MRAAGTIGDIGQVEEAVAGFLAEARRPVLVLTELTPAELGADRAQGVHWLGDGAPDEQIATVLVVARDRGELRRLVSRTAALAGARTMGFIVGGADAPLPVGWHPMWPPIAELDVGVEEGVAVTRVDFVRRHRIDSVLARLASAGTAGEAGPAGVRVVVAAGATPPLLDPTAVAAYDAEAKCPADVVLAVAPSSEPPPASITGRPPVTVVDGEVTSLAVDEGLHNPIGNSPLWRQPQSDAEVTTALSAGDLAERAMRGLPLRGTLSPEAERAVGPELAGLITSGPDQSDDLGREVHSVRVRRAALVAHSTRAWRIELGERAGARTARYPTVSLLLPTRRPEQLEFVLGQVAGLRHRLPGAEVELVLAAHGWEPDAAIVAELSGGLPHTIVTQSADTLFGDVLRAATYAASGRVLVKIDDDDWYAPDFVTDLLLARHYSGAEIVGTPAEFVYVEPRDVTVRRKGPSERYGAVVAGGTMSIEASVLREVGGFRRVRRFVDAQLLDAVLHAGGRVYRTHGLGYVLRRTDSGHTWDPGLDYFLRPETLAGQWAGFSPSGLFEQGGGAG